MDQEAMERWNDGLIAAYVRSFKKEYLFIFLKNFQKLYNRILKRFIFVVMKRINNIWWCRKIAQK
jgi:hypothetical protein